MVTSSDAFTGENFRRGGFLDYADATSGPPSSSARHGAVGLLGRRRDRRRRGLRAVRAPRPAGRVRHHGEQFDITRHFTVPRSPQRHPVILQAGDIDGGREFAAATADAIFSRHWTLEDGQAFYQDVKAPLPVRPLHATT